MTGCATCYASGLGMRIGIAHDSATLLGSASSDCAPGRHGLFVAPQTSRLYRQAMRCIARSSAQSEPALPASQADAAMRLRADYIRAARFHRSSPVTPVPAAYLQLSVSQEGGLGSGLDIYRAVADDMSRRATLYSASPPL